MSHFRRTPLLDAALAEAKISVESSGIPLTTIIECSEHLQRTRKSGPIYVHELLAGSDLIVEPPVIPPKVESSTSFRIDVLASHLIVQSPEYLAWKAAAEARYAQIQYDKVALCITLVTHVLQMVSNVTAQQTAEEGTDLPALRLASQCMPDAGQLSSFRSQASLAANHVITLATCFVACFYLGSRYSGDTGFVRLPSRSASRLFRQTNCALKPAGACVRRDWRHRRSDCRGDSLHHQGITTRCRSRARS